MTEAQEEWIFKYMSEKKATVSVLDIQFVNDFQDAFPNLKVKPVCFGALIIPQLGRILSNMVKKEWLQRRIVSDKAGNWGSGFPKWVYEYRIWDGGF